LKRLERNFSKKIFKTDTCYSERSYSFIKNFSIKRSFIDIKVSVHAFQRVAGVGRAHGLKTLGRCPNTPQAFEKACAKL
jgi:hypothetical protein